MTLQEFKAWFEGYTESMAKAPTEKQWARVKARVKEIDGTVITQRVFVDHYYPPYRRIYDGWQPVYGTAGVATAAGKTQTVYNGLSGMSGSNQSFAVTRDASGFSSLIARAYFGRAEACDGSA